MIIIWFNGPSRQKLIDKFPIQSTEIGCNFIRQDRAVQHVCIFDRSLWSKITHDDGVKYYTHPAWQKTPWHTASHPFAEAANSGMLAVMVAYRLSTDPIYILGCDWGLTKQSVYEYSRKEQIKYGNLTKKSLNTINKERDIFVVHDSRPDVDQNIITTDKFLDLILNK